MEQDSDGSLTDGLGPWPIKMIVDVVPKRLGEQVHAVRDAVNSLLGELTHRDREAATSLIASAVVNDLVSQQRLQLPDYHLALVLSLGRAGGARLTEGDLALVKRLMYRLFVAADGNSLDLSRSADSVRFDAGLIPSTEYASLDLTPVA